MIAVPASLSRPGLVPSLVALVFFMQFLDSTIIATSLPAMAASFGVEPITMSVGISAYLLALAAVIPAAGWLGERWGARKILVVSVVLFTAASLACAWAPGLWTFVAARVVQGAAAALMAPVGRMLVLGHAPKSELMNAIATITWPALFAPVLGPVLGAWITETVGWEWNFLINLPLGVVAIIAFLVLVPERPRSRARPFDGLGFTLCSLSLLGVLGGLELFVNGVDPEVATAVLGSGLILGALAWWHMACAVAPLFDLRILEIPSFRLATMTAGSLGRIGVNATPFLLPLLFQLGFGLSAIETGQLVLVYFLGNLLMKGVTTPVLRAFGFRKVVVGNGLLVGLSVGAFATVVPNDWPALLLFALLFVAGATRSLQFTALNTLAFADITESQRATSTTVSAMTQQVAQLLGVALPVVLIHAAQSWHGAPEVGLPEIRLAFLVMGAVGVVSALAFLRLAPGTGREVTGHPG